MQIVSGGEMCEEGVSRMKFTAGQLKHIYIPGCWEESEPLKYQLTELIRTEYFLFLRCWCTYQLSWLWLSPQTSNGKWLETLYTECTAEFESVPLAHLG